MSAAAAPCEGMRADEGVLLPYCGTMEGELGRGGFAWDLIICSRAPWEIKWQE